MALAATDQAHRVGRVLPDQTEPPVVHVEGEAPVGQPVERGRGQAVTEVPRAQAGHGSFENDPVDILRAREQQQIDVPPHVGEVLPPRWKQELKARLRASLAQAAHHVERGASPPALPIRRRQEEGRWLKPRAGEPIGQAHQDGILLGEREQQAPVDGGVGERKGLAVLVQQQPEGERRVVLLRGGGHASRRSLIARSRARRVSSKSAFGSTTAVGTRGAMCWYAALRRCRYATEYSPLRA